jgi:two-component system cell cycle response regulator
MIYQTIKVLLVEDMVMIAKINEQMLKKSPTNRYSVTHKVDLAGTIAALKADEFDVVLLDLNLPDSRDLDTLARVVETAPETPVIVLTASNDDEVGLKAVKVGAQDFLLKGDFNYLTLDRAIVYSIERHRLQRTIRQLAVLDELTGLYNRRGFNSLNPDVIEKVKTTGQRGFLCYFDLDRFKQINDVLGHAKGDEALKEFSANIQSVFRKDVLLVRLGGDEFVAMGVEQHSGQAEQALQSLNVLLSVRNAQQGCLFVLEASAGITYFDQSGPHKIEELSAAADAALYQDKESRRRARAKAHPDLQLQEDRR